MSARAGVYDDNLGNHESFYITESARPANHHQAGQRRPSERSAEASRGLVHLEASVLEDGGVAHAGQAIDLGNCRRPGEPTQSS